MIVICRSLPNDTQFSVPDLMIYQTCWVSLYVDRLRWKRDVHAYKSLQRRWCENHVLYI